MSIVDDIITALNNQDRFRKLSNDLAFFNAQTKSKPEQPKWIVRKIFRNLAEALGTDPVETAELFASILSDPDETMLPLLRDLFVLAKLKRPEITENVRRTRANQQARYEQFKASYERNLTMLEDVKRQIAEYWENPPEELGKFWLKSLQALREQLEAGNYTESHLTPEYSSLLYVLANNSRWVKPEKHKWSIEWDRLKWLHCDHVTSVLYVWIEGLHNGREALEKYRNDRTGGSRSKNVIKTV